jgi:hypothetical protein
MLFQRLLSVLAICGAASGTAIPRRRDDAAPTSTGISVKVNLTSNPLYTTDGPSNQRRSLAKHNNRRVKRDVNTWNGTATYNSGRYLCPIGIEGKTFSLEFDTGSADFWVLSTLTNASDVVGTHALYDPSTSNTSVAFTNYTWLVGYNDQSGASGVVYEDTVLFGEMEVTKQPIQVAETVFGDLVGAPIDGILGMSIGSNHVTPSDIPTFLQNLLNHPLQSSLFTVMLTRPGEVIQSFVTFGVIDESFVDNKTIAYQPVFTGRGLWEFPTTYALVNGNTIPRAANNTAIVDTGTTLILLDDATLKAIYTPLGGYFNATLNNGTGGWVFPSTATLPAVTLPMGTTNVTLQSSDLTFSDAGGGLTYGSLQSRGEIGYDVFGDVWLNNVYAIFDMTDLTVPRIGVVSRSYDGV